MKIPNIISLLHGNHILQRHVDPILKSTNASVYLKDKWGVYMDANHTFLNSCLLDSESDVIGQKDLDLIWTEQAQLLYQNDQEVIRADTAKTIIEEARSYEDKKIHLFLSHKIPLKNDMGKITGVFGISFIILDEQPTSPYFLSNRQMECIILLIKGMTCKQIASHLKLSLRTIEHYIEAVKDKLGCDTRSELISKALQMHEIKRRLFL